MTVAERLKSKLVRLLGPQTLQQTQITDEQLLPPIVRQLPESPGTEYAATREAVQWYKQVVDEPQGEFESPLPFIIGYVPENEREFFSTFKPEGLGSYIYDLNDPRTIEFRNNMPETYALIMSDVEKIDPELSFVSWLIDRKLTKSGRVERMDSERPHTDSGVHYLISDKNPTQFYEGKFPFWRRDRLTMYIYEDSLQGVVPVAAPPFAIVRQTPKNLHISPKFSEDAVRTFALFEFRHKKR